MSSRPYRLVSTGEFRPRATFRCAISFAITVLSKPSPAFGSAGSRTVFDPILGRKIFWLQFDRRAMRRAIRGVVPGIAIAVQGFGSGDPLRRDQFFERREPVPVVGFAGVGIAALLRALDFFRERGRPFIPAEQSAFMEG